MKRNSLILALLCALPLIAAADEAPAVRANVSEVKDTRAAKEFFSGLEVKLDLLGSALRDAKAYRFNVDRAVDDLGTDLKKEEEKKDLEEIDRFGRSGGSVSITVDLKNPPRRAQYVKELSGTLELFAPKKDPDAVVRVENAGKLMGSPVESPKLEKGGVKIVLLTKEQYEEMKKKPEVKPAGKSGEELGQAFAQAFGAMFGGFGAMSENSVIMKVTDPNNRVIAIEFTNGSGEQIDSTGRMTTGETAAYDFSEPLPEDYGIRVLLATPGALLRVPLTVRDIALP